MVLNLFWATSRLACRFQSSRALAHCESSTDDANEMRTHPLAMSNEDAAVHEAATELDDKMERLSQVLAGHIAIEGEAERLHQALLRQEQADAMRLMEILQRNEEACNAAVEEAKYTVERELTERIHQEQRAMRDLNSSQLQVGRMPVLLRLEMFCSERAHPLFVCRNSARSTLGI
jgi:hypothetical protein